MTNAWVQHVREFADKKKMKYTDAMKSAECKAEYQKNKPKSSNDMKEDMNKVIMKAPKKTSKKKMEATPELKAVEMPIMANVEVKAKTPRIRKSKAM